MSSWLDIGQRELGHCYVYKSIPVENWPFCHIFLKFLNQAILNITNFYEIKITKITILNHPVLIDQTSRVALLLKGTVSVISSDLHANMTMPDLQSLKALSDSLIKYKSDIYIFLSFNCLFPFAVSLQKWFANLLLIKRNGDISRIKHFRVRKTTVSSKFLIRLRI